MPRPRSPPRAALRRSNALLGHSWQVLLSHSSLFCFSRHQSCHYHCTSHYADAIIISPFNVMTRLADTMSTKEGMPVRKPVRGAYSVPGWQSDPVRVFPWLRMWSLLLNPSAMSQVAKNNFLARRADVHGIGVGALQRALMLYWLHQEADRRFRQMVLRPRRRPAA